MPSFAAFLALWSPLHGGYDPHGSRLALGWLRVTYLLARPLARVGIAPSALTAAGVALGILVPVAVAGNWRAAAPALVVAVALADGLDGAVAVLRGRLSRLGALADALADRFTEGCFVGALYVLGAPGWLCVAAAAMTFLLEYARTRAAAAGVAEVGTVTVWERPQRVVVTMLTLALAALLPAAAPWGWLGAAGWGAAGAVGAAQYAWWLARRLGGDRAADDCSAWP